MKKECYRHGDVILVPREVPAGAVLQKEKQVVLAYGEVTGHSHAMNGACMMFKYSDARYLRVQDELVELRHEEHGCLQIPQGDYEIIIQKDFEPSGWKNVQD